MNSKGQVTSHLSGLFYRNISLLQEGIKPVYVFDGVPPQLKQELIEKRKKAKLLAAGKFEEAKKSGDEESMRKYASQTVRMDEAILSQSKELLGYLGIPVIQADGEGEAEASLLAREKKVWATASQDYDALLYGTPYLLRNLTLARRRKTSAGIFVDVAIEFVEFEEVLSTLSITLDQLICLAILVGTDYNPGGVKGIGQKKALDLVKQYPVPEELFVFVASHEKYVVEFDWKEIFDQFKNYRSSSPLAPVFKKLDKEKVLSFLKEHEFSEERILSGLEKLELVAEQKKQKGLKDFF
jgi:flap endonuclease-1